HRNGEISFAGACRADSKNDVVLLDRFDVIALPRRSRDDWRLARRSDDFRQGKVVKTFVARFGHRIQSVIKFVLLDVHTFLTRLIKLLEHMLRFVDPAWFSFQSYPAFAGSHLNAKDVFKALQEFKVVSVE